MRGASAVLTAVLLMLVTVASAALFFNYYNRLRVEAVSTGEEQLAELKIPPKLVSLVCYDGYGYLLLSPSAGQGEIEGRAYYSAELDSGDLVKEGYLDLNLSQMDEVYLPVPFDVTERYVVELSAKEWKLTETCTPLNDPQLVLHLPFDAGEGTRAEDTSDYDNHGTIANATWVQGIAGDALEFNGNNSYVVVSDDTSLDDNSSLTLAAWVRTTVEDGWVVDTQEGSHRGWRLGVENNVTEFGVYAGDLNAGYTELNGNAVLTDGSWHHIVGTWNGSQMTTYVDGTQDTQGTQPGLADSSQDLMVGVRDLTAGFFNGTIDDVRAYGRALSAEEVAALHGAYGGGAP